MPAETVRVKGLRELQRALKDADRELRLAVRAELREAGEIVRREGQALFERYSPKSAAGYRVRVRQRGVAVEQSLRRTTGLHPEWGRLQLREALEPALDAKQDEVVGRLEDAVDNVADRFN
jgi:hypothetical protein